VEREQIEAIPLMAGKFRIMAAPCWGRTRISDWWVVQPTSSYK